MKYFNLKKHLPVFLVNILSMIFFSWYYLATDNAEFMVYIAVLIFFIVVIGISMRRVNYSMGVLWGLTIWALLHMMGGSVHLSGVRLYDLMIFTWSEGYQILKFDQVVHMFGFFIATLAMFEVLEPALKKPIKHWVALFIGFIMIGTGLGAVNEMVEFMATVFASSTGVGGYINTSLDIISNFIGAFFAMLVILWKNNNHK